MDDLYGRPSIAEGIKTFARRWPGVVSHSDEQPIFILAAGWRSGSTLLQRLISAGCFVWGEPYGHSWLVDSLAAPLRCMTDDWPQDFFFFKEQTPEQRLTEFITNLYPSPEHLLQAHQRYFETLFIGPARQAGASRWGIKEVRWTADHASYLKWLYPQAKFLLLYRNPYDAYRSYAARRKAGWNCYNRWPDQPVTAGAFGRHWRELVSSFLQHAEELNGLLIRYEDLASHDFKNIEAYIGFDLSQQAAAANPSDGGQTPLADIAPPELAELQQHVGELAVSLGYRLPEVLTPAVAPAPGAIPQPKCAVLVPVGGQVEPECDAALQELERRGYVVRRVRGYAAIDQGRNQMVTDALGDGFEETMWVDADIAFTPDTVERLRSHNLPIVCGIYPQKGRRALACHVVPGSDKLVFGEAGGLVEILYAATGFLFVRRQVYEDVQTTLQLPLCNERFGKPMVPFFQPLIRPDHGGHWYLAEDYAFSERVRQCGYKIFADTTIRLGHIGKYAFTWEDAGSPRQRYATYNFHLTEDERQSYKPANLAKPTVASQESSQLSVRLKQLAAGHPWPAERPAGEVSTPEPGLVASTKQLLMKAAGPPPRLLVTVDAPAPVVREMQQMFPAVHQLLIWGPPTDRGQRELARKQLRAQLWDLRDHLVIFEHGSLAGLKALSQLQLQPDLIYLHLAEPTHEVREHLRAIAQHSPGAKLVGCGWDWEEVRRTLTAFSRQFKRQLQVEGISWSVT